MIQEVFIENFQSIKDKQHIDFRPGPKYVRASNEDDVSVLNCFIGGNAAGKTTVLRALSVVRWLIADSFGGRPLYMQDDAALPIKGFAGNLDKIAPTNLVVRYTTNGDTFEYAISVNRSQFLSESLSVRSLTSSRVTSKNLFTRKWNAELEKFTITSSTTFPLIEKNWESSELKNSSLISAAARFGHQEAKLHRDFWRKDVSTNVEIDEMPYRYGPYGAYHALDRISKKSEKERERYSREIRRYDLGVRSIDSEGRIMHSFGPDGADEFALSIEEESTGTQRYIELNDRLEQVIAEGGIAIIDEIDIYLHPKMTHALIRKFTRRSKRKCRGQLIFSTHNVGMLGLLKRNQIFFATKRRGATTFRRFDDVRGVRSSEDFIGNYMKGKYGGINVIEED